MNARQLAFTKRQLEEALIADALIANDYNVTKTARELHVRRETVERVRKTRGLPSNHKAGPRVDGAREIERTAVRRELHNGASVKAITRLTGVPETTVRRWRAEWQDDATCQD